MLYLTMMVVDWLKEFIRNVFGSNQHDYSSDPPFRLGGQVAGGRCTNHAREHAWVARRCVQEAPRVVWDVQDSTGGVMRPNEQGVGRPGR